MQRLGWMLFGILDVILVAGFIIHIQAVRGYEAQVADFRQEMDQIKSNQGHFADHTGDVKLVSLVDEKTGKLRYEALDPKFLDAFWKTDAQVLKIQRALGSYGYKKGGEPNPVTFDVARAFDSKVHSAEFLLKSGYSESARALLLSALAEADVDIYTCGKAPATHSFYESELPFELLPLLQGSPYTAVSYKKDTVDGERVVQVGVSKEDSYMKGC